MIIHNPHASRKVDDMDRACTISQSSVLLYRLGYIEQAWTLAQVEEYMDADITQEEWIEHTKIMIIRQDEMEATYKAHGQAMARD